jgi:hypothetical protein
MGQALVPQVLIEAHADIASDAPYMEIVQGGTGVRMCSMKTSAKKTQHWSTLNDTCF